MKKSTRFFALCLALTMCATMAMTGALGEAPQPTAEATAAAETTAAPEAAAALPTPAPDALLATVNGESVTYAMMQKMYDNLYYQYTSQGYDLTGQESILQSIAMDWAVTDIIVRQKAAEFKVDQFTAEEATEFQNEAQTTWDNYMDQQASAYLTSESPTDEEKANARKQAEDAMAQSGLTKEKAMEELVANFRDQKIQELVIDYLAKDFPALTDEEVLTEYQSRVDADKASFSEDIRNYIYAAEYSGQQVWYTPEGIRGITHILLAVDPALMEKYNSIQAELEEQNNDTVDVAEPTADPATSPAGEATATLDPAATATPAPVTEADLEAAKQAILDSVKDKTDAIKTRYAAGEDFAALIAEFGTDPGMTAEPDKTNGYSVLAQSIKYYPVFVTAAFSPEMQKVGDLSLPVVSTKGVHILRYNRDVPSGPVELTDELKATLRSEMEKTRKDGALPKAIDEWKKASKIEYTGLVPTFAPAPEATPEPAAEATQEPVAEATPEITAAPAN